MNDSVKRYVGVLIDRICELSLENRILQEMVTVPPGPKWRAILAASLQSPEAHQGRMRFDARKAEILQLLEDQGEIDKLLNLPTKGLPN